MRVLKIVFTCGLFFSAAHISQAQFQPSEWPKYEYEFSTEGTLKEVFDSGIRPYRFPTLEKKVLEFKHCRLDLRVRGGSRLPEIPIDWATINVLSGGLIDSLELTTPDLSLSKAREAMLPWVNFGSSSVETLNEFIAAVEANHLDYEYASKDLVRSVRAVWTDSSGIRFTVFFKKSFSTEFPLSLAVKISWAGIRTPLQRRSTYKSPIPPPPGYADVSMEPEGSIGPDSGFDILRSKGLPVSGKEPIFGKNDESLPAKSTPSRGRDSNVVSKNFEWWYLALSIFILAILAKYLFGQKKANPTRD